MNNKTVIYVDVEDEITNVIDKVNTAKSKVVALVLPKRATVFQSVVNMKLLKKKATEAKKNVILVTSEAGLMPLAGAVGVHVAKSLQAKPEIPPNPNVDVEDEGPINLEDDTEPDEDQIDNKKTVGELAGLAAVGAVAAKNNNEPENIDFDNDAVSPDPMGLSDIDKEAKPPKAKKAKKAKGINGKSTKVPDFNKFKKILIIGGAALILLILFYIFGFKVWPKATITVQTNTSSVNSTIPLTLSQSQGGLDAANAIVPAKFQTVTKQTTSGTVNTTGSKTIGTSATGTITVTNNCNNSSDYTIPSGTTFTDSSGTYSYTSTSSETIKGTGISIYKQCTPRNSTTVSVPVTATQVGANYNIGPTSFSSSDGTLSAGGYGMGSDSPMSGGSSKQVQVVDQADINSAQSQIAAPNSSQVKQQLESSLNSEGYVAIPATFVSNTPVNTPSASVGVQANSVTVTQVVTYTMYGAKQSDLNTLAQNSVNQQINPASQSVLGTGVSSATFTLDTTGSSTDKVTMQVSATVGPKISASQIAKESAGQKSGDIKSTISETPGVTNVTVKYSPFWVTSTPSNVKKITVIIEKANGSQP